MFIWRDAGLGPPGTRIPSGCGTGVASSGWPPERQAEAVDSPHSRNGDDRPASTEEGRPISTNATQEAPAIPALRYETGLYLFIIGNIVTLASPAVVPALGPSAAYIGAAVIVFECVILSSVFFLRWKGMKELKGKML